MSQWVKGLQKAPLEYEPDDVFNKDETALFFKLLPDGMVKGDRSKVMAKGKNPRKESLPCTVKTRVGQ